MVETTEIRLTRLESDVGHIRSDVADLKADVRELRRDFADLRRELTRGLLETRIGMLLLCATMLGVMARGFHWI